MMSRFLLRCLNAFLVLGLHGPARADDAAAQPNDEPAAEHPFKLTLGWYRFSDNANGFDANLRHSDEESIRRWGFTITYDWPRVFIRLARDPKTNFTPVDAWRLSFGTRF